LEREFGIKDVVVVSNVGYKPEMSRKAVGQAGAYYLSKNLKDVKRLGISWGTTVAEVDKEYPYERREGIKIIPLEGGMGRQSVEIHANQLAYDYLKR
jgi:DNA-binding transcriptional regulator LsrR (DeoR family)